MNAFEQAKKENGIAIVDGVVYAIGVTPEIDNYDRSGVVYKSYGFTESMIDENGDHDPMFDESVKLIWDCTDFFSNNDEEEFDCDWEREALVA